MADDKQSFQTAEPEACYSLTLTEVTRSFGVTVETIVEIVEEGIVSLPEEPQDRWIFDATALNRIRTVIHLNRDLGINCPGAAMILDLLEEIERLRHR